MRTNLNVSANEALKTPQFWFLWVVLFTNVTAGIGILKNAALMIQDYFPGITAAAAAGFVGILSLANMAGRFDGRLPDYIGRKNIYLVYLGWASSYTCSSLSLAEFDGAVYYRGDLYSVVLRWRFLHDSGLSEGCSVCSRLVIHGRLLTAWAAAGIAGPLIVNSVVESQAKAGNEGPDLYTLSMFIMVGLLAVGLIANILMRPVAEKHTIENGTKVGASR